MNIPPELGSVLPVRWVVSAASLDSVFRHSVSKGRVLPSTLGFLKAVPIAGGGRIK